MMKTKNLKPNADVLVRKPDGSHLAKEGESLTLTAYWLRRIAEGDVAVSDIPSPKAEVAPVESSVSKNTKTEK
ncbi:MULTISPECIES: DUF2635 domain-containing protein [unclassified Serratia (in: enterobacteria)]|uniref:DUF2635 domain-containing protein n=1 Tax=unclassified Serratia (in: enterobacteria) TaxID=2647522 RepID=UPI0027E7C43C|nr:MULTISPECIES: DUF2635 domain-containing protein [unclassified Serratia (in: enterobacteria)]MDQ7097420.1 DUF2635 domain-containing protein [Serratia sp. MF2]MDQ7104877.1 DUF2635 domain-containing protein [Serratia sp. MF1(2023)]